MDGIPLTNGISTKYPIADTVDYTVYIEPFDGLLWYHCDIHRWTASVKKKFITHNNKLLDSFCCNIYALNENDGGEKRGKWGTIVGFRKAGMIQTSDGEEHELYVRVYYHG